MNNKYYILNKNEFELWEAIKEKVKIGDVEWRSYKIDNPRMLCAPWTKRLTTEENALLEKIFGVVCPGNYCSDSMGWDQMSRWEYDEVYKYVLKKHTTFTYLYNLFYKIKKTIH